MREQSKNGRWRQKANVVNLLGAGDSTHIWNNYGKRWKNIDFHYFTRLWLNFHTMDMRIASSQ